MVDELFAEHVNSPSDADHARGLLFAGAPRKLLRRGLKAGLNWSDIWAAFVKYGLPILLDLLKQLLAGKLSVAEFRASVKK